MSLVSLQAQKAVNQKLTGCHVCTHVAPSGWRPPTMSPSTIVDCRRLSCSPLAVPESLSRAIWAMLVPIHQSQCKLACHMYVAFISFFLKGTLAVPQWYNRSVYDCSRWKGCGSRGLLCVVQHTECELSRSVQSLHCWRLWTLTGTTFRS